MKKNKYAIIVKNKTRLERLVERFNTKSQSKYYVESNNSNFEDYELEHEVFYKSLEALQTALSKVMKNKVIDRDFLPSFLFSNQHIIIVIGQDGLVANTAKYANGCPIVAVNPDKDRYDGVLLPFDTENFIQGVERTFSKKNSCRTVGFAEVKLNDGQRLLAFNDLYIGASSHVSARYKITHNQQEEQHSSSGIIVSTQAGATGWMSSIFNMAYGITNLFERDLKLRQPSLESDELIFAVREPFQSLRTQIDISSGIIQGQNKLTIESLMPTNGIIFSDGIESDFLKFNSGALATIGIASETANLVN